jgi:hypothetical protein
VETLSDYHVARGAGSNLAACVLDFNALLKQCVADRGGVSYLY